LYIKVTAVLYEVLKLILPLVHFYSSDIIYNVHKCVLGFMVQDFCLRMRNLIMGPHVQVKHDV